ncbi:MAG: substrate-binding domain-containing protein [Anaerolineae bacterium]|nr:substrate-binding domain-containing protein [Anaerolineae bacterium]
MQFKRFLFVFVLLALILGSLVPAAIAAPPHQGAVACEQEVIVQADDWLSKIAEKAYGDVLAYPAIAEATNAKNAEDSSFAAIENVDVIEVGWKLCVPNPADAEALLERSLAAPEVAVSPAQPTGQQVGRLVLATTTSTQDSGLLDVILPDFETRYGADVEVIAVGTGQSIELGRNCDADVVLVHARKQEDAFVADGAGINRQDVMYNDFVILGPASDPAGIKGMTDAAAGLIKISETQSPFISRGDNSGTHTKEQSLWEATGLTLIEAADVDPTKPYKRPEGDWYQSVGQGMGAVLTIANEQQAYTLSDRATYLARKLEGTELEILVEGDSRLFNPYGVIEVNPEKCPSVNAAGAHAFVEWMTSLETQTLISQFGADKFGQPLFVPDSAAWNAAKPQ